MQVVTAFESDTPEQDLAKNVEEKFDYSQVEGALKNDRTVAENVFARCAKHHFRKKLGDAVNLAKDEDPLPDPLWFHAASVTIFIDDQWQSVALEALVDSLAGAVLQIRKEKGILLVGPLETRILEVSPKLFSFSLKQKWGLDGKR